MVRLGCANTLSVWWTACSVAARLWKRAAELQSEAARRAEATSLLRGRIADFRTGHDRL